MNALEVRGLSKTYPAFTLKDVSFDVPQGAVVGFIGRNGAGKSTTLKSILELVHPDGGDVRFFGQDVRQHEREFKEQIGVVLGGIDFYPKKKVKTITDVTRRFYRNWDETKYRHYLELFRIDESKRVDQLSSGMKVKYLLALALSHNAKLLILDEPTSGLDPVSRDELVALFRDDPQVVAYGAAALRYQCITFCVQGWVVMGNMMQQSMGKTVPATFMAVARQGLFFIPAVWILSAALGFTGVQLSQSAADLITFAVSIPIQARILRELPQDKIQKTN